MLNHQLKITLPYFQTLNIIYSQKATSILQNLTNYLKQSMLLTRVTFRILNGVLFLIFYTSKNK